jgi:hypothetical protein
MNIKRLGLPKLLAFERIYSDIEKEYEDDPRVERVREQLQEIREAIYELRVEQGIPIPPVKISAQTLAVKARRG